jgi:rSAM/selenodomain-associated transferase 2
MKLSIIIPTYNEEDNICSLLSQLLKVKDERIAEIIVTDAGSTDLTCSEALKYPVKLITTSKQCRAYQMNVAAREAIGDVLYFVHADTRPPISFVDDIDSALADNYSIGSYSFKLDSKDPRLKLLSFMTRINMLISRGGDQTLFVTKSLFQDMNGFDEKFVIMEDFDFIRRARKRTKFKLLNNSVLVSARKYAKNSYTKVQWANLNAFLMFYFGVPPQKIKEMYQRRLQS